MSEPLRGLHLHFDPSSGIAGDMTVAALVDAGVPRRIVSDAIAAMGVRDLRVRFEVRRRGGLVGQGFLVEAGRTAGRPRAPSREARGEHHAALQGPRALRGSRKSAARDAVPRHAEHEHEHDHEHDHAHDHPDGHHPHHHGAHELARPDDAVGKRHPRGAPPIDQPRAGHAARPRAHAHEHRDYSDIRTLLRRAKLDRDVKALAEDMFRRIAAVEAALHGTAVERVAFHEVGAYDSIADVVGVSAAIVHLAPAAITSGPPVLGTGAVRTAHGTLPVPAPATAALLRGIPVVFEGAGELTTPTGAAVLAAVVDEFGPPPPLDLTAVGYGAGSRELPDRPNVLRALLGRPVGARAATTPGAVLLLETNLDDMNPQLVPALFDALFAAGALDVWGTPLLMKKGRPATMVSALCDRSNSEALIRAFFVNSTTLGVRMREVERAVLGRSMVAAQTPFGAVRVKVAALDGHPIRAQPELDDCRRVAAAARVPVQEVWRAAMAASTAISLPSAAGQGGARTAPVKPIAFGSRQPVAGQGAATGKTGTSGKGRRPPSATRRRKARP